MSKRDFTDWSPNEDPTSFRVAPIQYLEVSAGTLNKITVLKYENRDMMMKCQNRGMVIISFMDGSTIEIATKINDSINILTAPSTRNLKKIFHVPQRTIGYVIFRYGPNIFMKYFWLELTNNASYAIPRCNFKSQWIW